jgi:hypothetical protein
MAPFRLVTTAFLLSFSTAAQDLDDAIQRLVQHFGRRPVAVTWQNVSTMPDDEVDRARQRFESAFEVSAAGIEVKATLSENPRGYVLVLQTTDGKVFVENWTRPPARPIKPPFRLKQMRLGESPRPILDAGLSPDGQRLILLEAFRVSNNEKSAGLPIPRPLPRDPRGRVQVSDDGEIRVQLPGVHCTGSLARMQCLVTDQPWIVIGRNYFKGGHGTYYSMAELENGVVESELDGLTRLYLNGNDSSRVLENWGSELAAVEPGCGSKVQVIASLETEQAQAFEYTGGRMKAATEPLPMDGPIVAMWTAGERKDQVTIVVRNRTKGTYEASRLAIACSAE